MLLGDTRIAFKASAAYVSIFNDVFYVPLQVFESSISSIDFNMGNLAIFRKTSDNSKLMEVQNMVLLKAVVTNLISDILYH